MSLKHYLSWFEKGEDGEFVGEKELVDIDSEELKRLNLFDSTCPVFKLEQFKYLSKFINFKFWTDKYDYFVESSIGE
jgi:hypothetical protein